MKEKVMQYEEPTIEVIRFTEQDVITTSGLVGLTKNTEGEYIQQTDDPNYVFHFN